MTTSRAPFSCLPPEIVLRILSFFDPISDIRSFRLVIASFKGTAAQQICATAEGVLQCQRDNLLQAWHQTRAELAASPVSAEDEELITIADGLIGKQYVSEKEGFTADYWVSWP